jgi:hypothetical protein
MPPSGILALVELADSSIDSSFESALLSDRVALSAERFSSAGLF